MRPRFIILLLALLLPGIAFAQVSKERDVVANGGEYSSAPGLALSWTVGEAAINTGQAANLIVTEGFQQADSDPVGTFEAAFPGDITIYPNPVEDQLTFEVTTPSPVRMKAELYDLNGKLVRQVPAFQTNRSYTGNLDFSELPAGK